FAEGVGSQAEFYGLNLFFDGHSLPDISVKAPLRTTPTIPTFSVNSAANTFGTDGSVIFPVAASGKLTYVSANTSVTLTQFYWAIPEGFNVDRVGPLSAFPSGRADSVGLIILSVTNGTIISPPPPPPPP